MAAIKRWFEHLRDSSYLSLRGKILVLMVITWIIAISAISSVAISGQFMEARSKTVQQDIRTLSDAKSQVEDFLETINLIGIRFSQDENVKLLLSDESQNLQAREQLLILIGAAKYLYDSHYITNLSSTYSTLLYDADGHVYTNSHSMLYPVTDADTALNLPSDMTAELSPQQSHQFGYQLQLSDITVTHTPDLIAYTRIFPLALDAKSYGGIKLLFDQSIFKEAFSSVSSPKDWIVFNQDGEIISSSIHEHLGAQIETVCGITLEGLLESDGYVRITEPSPALLTYTNSSSGNLYYALITPNSLIFETCSRIIATVIEVALICLAALLWFSGYLTKRFTDPLRKLSEKMHQAETGDLSVRVQPKFHDEIAQLGKHFDQMIIKLARSMEDLQNSEQAKRQAELRVLELQVNPHFLYNTLSSIIWLANEKKCDEIMDITKSLALFYRFALSSGSEVIPIETEIQHIKNYLNIQNYRYESELTVEYEIDPAIMQYDTLKLILQPLVENAIYHGIRSLETPGGIIRICGGCNEGVILLQVMDNGATFTEADAQRLNSCLIQDIACGIGTSNVNNRIRLHYGDAYGLRFSRLDGWTVATIRFPMTKQREDQDAVSSSDRR